MVVIGAVISVASAFSFAVNNVLARRGMTGASASQGAFITVLLGVPLFAVAALVSGQLFRIVDLPLNGYLLLSAAGILHFGLGRYCNYRAIGAIGSARAEPIQAMSIPYSVFIAFVFLGETINWTMAFGILLVMVGPAVIVERHRGAGPVTPVTPEPPRGAAQDVRVAPAFQLRQVEGYTFAVLSSMCYGTSPMLIRAALQGQTDLSVVGGLISYLAAACFVLAALALPGNRVLVRAINLRAIRIFFGAGFFVFLAQMLRFIALSLAPVAVVNPLMRLGTVFTLLLAATFNRDIESINERVVLGVVISLVGSVVLVMGMQ